MDAKELLDLIEKADEQFFEIIEEWENNRNFKKWELCKIIETYEDALIANGRKCHRQKLGLID